MIVSGIGGIEGIAETALALKESAARAECRRFLSPVALSICVWFRVDSIWAKGP